ncbi:MAG: hypothetical protein IPM26_02420 [Saprospiraceae bacterium]|nr:hypothetical protein [Saprospiraceae bacterium]
MAEKLAKAIHCNTSEIHPVVNSIPILFLLSLLRCSIPVRLSDNALLENYDEIILIGPIWGGQLIAPLRTAIRKCKKSGKKFHFALTCESSESDKDGPYGYNHVFGILDSVASDAVLEKAAFSTTLVKNYSPEGRTIQSEKIRITEENYSEALKEKLMDFAGRIAKSD